jgi:hypothetical protein
MDISCRDQRGRDDSGKCGTDTHHCSPHASQPAASTANYGAVQAAVSDFPKNAGRCPKKYRSNHTAALPYFSSKRATGSRMLQERGNPGAQLMKRKDTSGATESWD